MSDVINFLEKMGQDANMRRATKNDLELKLTQTQIEPKLQAAILSGDQQHLESLLGAKANVCSFLAPKKEEEPAKDDDEIAGQLSVRSAATA